MDYITTLNFHGINVTVKLINEFNIDNIRPYEKNFRTILNYQKAEEYYNKKYDDLSVDELLEFMRSDKTHKLEKLGKNICKFGVYNPLIISNDGDLLDGNRRYFACKLMQSKNKNNSMKKDYCIDKLQNIPVFQIQETISQEQKDRIMASINFIDDYKEPWPRQVRFNYLYQLYNTYSTSNIDKDVYKYVEDIYDYSPGQLRHVLKIIEFIDHFKTWRDENYERLFNNTEKKEYQFKTELLMRDNFTYFEEYYNKSHKGRYAFVNTRNYEDVTNILYIMISNEEINSISSVRDLIQISQNHECLEIVINNDYREKSLKKAVDHYTHACVESNKYKDKSNNQLFDEVVENLLSLSKEINKQKVNKGNLVKIQNIINGILEN